MSDLTRAYGRIAALTAERDEARARLGEAAALLRDWYNFGDRNTSAAGIGEHSLMGQTSAFLATTEGTE